MNRLLQDSRGRRIATLLLLGTFCLVALLLFELGVRWLEPQPEEPYRFSPHTYYEPVPNADFVYARSEFRVPVRFNRLGMRDRERSLQKGADVGRIALLGDSFAEALQVPQDSMLSQRLERQLGSCLPGKTTEVLNFGVSGFGPAAAAARYASLARRFEPDVVVYLFVRNDPWDLVQQDSRLYVIRNDRLVLQPLQPSWLSRQFRAGIDFGKHHFHAQRFLKYRMVRWRDGSQQVAAAEEARRRDGELRPGDAAWQRLRLAFVLLEELTRDDGASFLVAQATTAGPAMNGQLARLCRELGIPFISLLPALEAAPGPVTFHIDGHWRSQGHAVASEVLAPWLCSALRSRMAPESAAPGTPGGESDL